MKEKTFRKETISTLRGLKGEELEVREVEAKEQLFWLEFKHRSGQLDHTANIGKTKKLLARIHTIRTEQKSAKRKDS